MIEIIKVKKLRNEIQKNKPNTSKSKPRARNDLFDDEHLLRKICAHPSLLDTPGSDDDSARARAEQMKQRQHRLQQHRLNQRQTQIRAN